MGGNAQLTLRVGVAFIAAVLPLTRGRLPTGCPPTARGKRSAVLVWWRAARIASAQFLAPTARQRYLPTDPGSAPRRIRRIGRTAESSTGSATRDWQGEQGDTPTVSAERRSAGAPPSRPEQRDESDPDGRSMRCLRARDGGLRPRCRPEYHAGALAGGTGRGVPGNPPVQDQRKAGPATAQGLHERPEAA